MRLDDDKGNPFIDELTSYPDPDSPQGRERKRGPSLSRFRQNGQYSAKQVRVRRKKNAAAKAMKQKQRRRK